MINSQMMVLMGYRPNICGFVSTDKAFVMHFTKDRNDKNKNSLCFEVVRHYCLLVGGIVTHFE